MWRRLIFNANGPKGKKKMCFFCIVDFSVKIESASFFSQGKEYIC